jgi:hypothetical protein
MDVVNRYATQDLYVAKEHHEQMQNYVARTDKDGRPFARQVDIWWAAIGLGVCIGHRTPLPVGDKATVKFNSAAILNTDPWRIVHLELLALAEEGPEVLDDPSLVIHIASEYAATGLTWALEKMLGEAQPTLTLMNRLGEFLPEKAKV